MNFIDKIGKKFGRLLVISLNGRDKNGKLKWNCVCDCGNNFVAIGERMAAGRLSSCGCFLRESRLKNRKTHGFLTNGIKPREYRIWSNMKTRCSNPKSNKFHIYGGRGIKVCERWASFESFIADMGKCPPGMSLDRINTNGNYEPGNCRWSTAKQQANNTRTNRVLQVGQEKKNLCQWSEQVGIGASTILRRINRFGWTHSEAIMTPVLTP